MLNFLSKLWSKYKINFVSNTLIIILITIILYFLYLYFSNEAFAQNIDLISEKTEQIQKARNKEKELELAREILETDLPNLFNTQIKDSLGEEKTKAPLLDCYTIGNKIICQKNNGQKPTKQELMDSLITYK